MFLIRTFLKRLRDKVNSDQHLTQVQTRPFKATFALSKLLLSICVVDIGKQKKPTAIPSLHPKNTDKLMAAY
jgi:hypothetical protein